MPVLGVIITFIKGHCNDFPVDHIVIVLSSREQSVPPAVIGNERLGDIPAIWVEAALCADALECFDSKWEAGFLPGEGFCQRLDLPAEMEDCRWKRRVLEREKAAEDGPIHVESP
jgi:hypothetical protein